MKHLRQFAVSILALALLFGPLASQSDASGLQAAPAINLTMTVPSSITSVCTVTVNFTPSNAGTGGNAAGVIPGDSPAVCTNSWTTSPSSGYIRVIDYMFFGAGVNALSNGVTNIPASAFYAGQSAAPTTPCNFPSNNNCFGANQVIDSIPLGTSNWTGSVTQTFYFAVNTNGISLTAGSYIGAVQYLVYLSNT